MSIFRTFRYLIYYTPDGGRSQSLVTKSILLEMNRINLARNKTSHAGVAFTGFFFIYVIL